MKLLGFLLLILVIAEVAANIYEKLMKDKEPRQDHDEAGQDKITATKGHTVGLKEHIHRSKEPPKPTQSPPDEDEKILKEQLTTAVTRFNEYNQLAPMDQARSRKDYPTVIYVHHQFGDYDVTPIGEGVLVGDQQSSDAALIDIDCAKKMHGQGPGMRVVALEDGEWYRVAEVSCRHPHPDVAVQRPKNGGPISAAIIKIDRSHSAKESAKKTAKNTVYHDCDKI